MRLRPNLYVSRKADRGTTMSRTQPTLTSIPVDVFDDMRRGNTAPIQRCETRLALSASLCSSATMELIDAIQPHAWPQQIVAGPDMPSVPDPDVHASNIDGGGPSNGTDGGLLDQAHLLQQQNNLTGAGQTVAVIDSGVAWDHVSLGGGFGPGYRVVGGWDFAENDADPYDDGPSGYHGTHVAGLLAGSMDGFAGVAPEADIVALRVFDDNGYGELQWIESALQWVHDSQSNFESPITTVNLSLGAALNDSNRDYAMGMLDDELQLLHEDGILVFAAAGNDYDPSGNSGFDDILYPASSQYVTAVSAIDDNQTLSDFAQRQAGILAAEGRGVTSAVPEHVFGWDGTVDDLAQLNGTSMATPQVAAASMLIREAMVEHGLQPTATEVLARLEGATTSHVDSQSGQTYRTIDLDAAVADLIDAPDNDESQDSPRSSILATNDSEQFVLDLRDGMKVTIGDQTYDLAASEDGSPIILDGSGGADSLTILGSDGAERLRLSPDATDSEGNSRTSRIMLGGVEIALRGFEDVRFDGGGGNDRVTLFDSVNDDSLESHPSHAVLSGVGYRFEVNAVSRTYVHATSGGDDIAYLYDSVGDDQLAVQPQFTSLRGTNTDGSESFQSAYGFESVYAYANNGGYDSADLQDSSGDDVLTISPTRSLVSSEGYQVSARGFENVAANAIAGGDDTVRIYSDEANSQWHRTDDLTQWSSADGATRQARGFENVEAFENFEPVDLSPQSLIAPLTDDEDEWLAAQRQVFERLGEAT